MAEMVRFESPAQPAEPPAGQPTGELRADGLPADVEAPLADRGVPAQVVPRSTNPRGTPDGSAIGEAWVWVGVLIVVTVLGGLGLMWYRRRVLAAATTEGAEGFMESMRRMRASGEMSEEEFQAVRRNLVAGIARTMKDAAPDKARGGR